MVVMVKRLPDWNDDKSIWVAAVKTEPLDPWCLNNAAHLTHDKRAAMWLVQLYSLKIPDWLPYNEREPYLIGLQGLRDSLRLSGHSFEADMVNNKFNEIAIGHKIVVGYVSH